MKSSMVMRSTPGRGRRGGGRRSRCGGRRGGRRRASPGSVRPAARPCRHSLPLPSTPPRSVPFLETTVRSIRGARRPAACRPSVPSTTRPSTPSMRLIRVGRRRHHRLDQRRRRPAACRRRHTASRRERGRDSGVFASAHGSRVTMYLLRAEISSHVSRSAWLKSNAAAAASVAAIVDSALPRQLGLELRHRVRRRRGHHAAAIALNHRR